MRICRHYVINKETNERVFSRNSLIECQEYISKQENPNNFVIGYKWMSI